MYTYRIPNPSLRVAFCGTQKSDDFLRRPVYRAGRSELLPHFFQAADHFYDSVFTFFRSGKEFLGFSGDSLRSKVILNQFRYDGAPGNQIHHAEELGFYQRLGQPSRERGEPVNGDHRFPQQRRFHRGRAAGNNREVGRA